MADSFNKKDREKKKRKKREAKAEKKLQRRAEEKTGDEFMYLNEDGNLQSTPPDPAKKRVIKAEDIDVSVPKKEKTEKASFTRTGVVKFFNTEKGYGFILDKETGDSIFVHIDNMIDKAKEHDKVTFETRKGPKGPIAVDVKLVSL